MYSLQICIPGFEWNDIYPLICAQYGYNWNFKKLNLK